MTDERFYQMLRSIFRARADFHRHLTETFSTPPLADTSGKAALLQVMETGSRFQVAAALRGLVSISISDMVCFLHAAWLADSSIPREVDSHNPGLTDREIYSLAVDLGAARTAGRLTHINSAGARGPAVAAVYLVGELRAAKRLAELVSHPRSTVRVGALQLCAALTDAHHLELLESLVESELSEVEAAALRVFCNLGTEAHLPHITDALRHPDEEVRLAAIGALARLRPPQAVQLLTETVDDESDPVRIAALTAIGAQGDLSTRSALLVGLNHRSVYHRIGAARGLTAFAERCPAADHLPILSGLQQRSVRSRTFESRIWSKTEATRSHLTRMLASENSGQTQWDAMSTSEVDELNTAIQSVARIAGVDPSTLIPVSPFPIPASPSDLKGDSLPIPDAAGTSIPD